MKRYYLYLICLLMCVSCVNNDTPVNHSTVNVEKVVLDNHYEFNTTEFTYKGHEYIHFVVAMSYGISGVVHNPDCKCFNKE